MRLSRFFFFLFPVLLVGCATVNPQKDYQAVYSLSKEITGYPIAWQQSDADSLQIQKTVSKLLKRGLTPQKAVRIALINNYALQAKFEMLGIARADVAQAGLFNNPSLNALFQFPFGHTVGGTSVDTDLLFTLSDLWNIPIRKNIASFDAQQVTLQIVSEIVKTAAQTREAYNDYLYQLALDKFTQKNIKLYEDELKINEQYYGSGLVNDISLYMVKNALYSEQVALARIKTDRKTAYARLMRLIGLDPLTNNVKIKGTLTDTQSVRLTLNEAWKYAAQNRVDLKIARLQIQQTKYILKLQKAKIFGDVGLGGGFTKELDKAKKLGPLLAFQLPLFNQNQAGIARAEYQLRQSKKALKADEARAKEEILQLVSELKFQRIHAKFYRDQMISVQRKAASFAKKNVNAMKMNRFVLIETRRRLLDAQRGFLTAKHDYTQAKINLDVALGGIGGMKRG